MVLADITEPNSTFGLLESPYDFTTPRFDGALEAQASLVGAAVPGSLTSTPATWAGTATWMTISPGVTTHERAYHLPEWRFLEDYGNTINLLQHRIITDPVNGVIVNVADSIALGAYTNGNAALHKLGFVPGVQVVYQGPHAVSGYTVLSS